MLAHSCADVNSLFTLRAAAAFGASDHRVLLLMAPKAADAAAPAVRRRFSQKVSVFYILVARFTHLGTHPPTHQVAC